MSTIDPHASVASLVLDHPTLAEPLERLDLDFCCHGDLSLEAACATRGLDVDTTVHLLDAYAASAPQGREHAFDARAASTAELCEHIVAAHHDRLRLELPRLGQTAATVVRVHGGNDPRLATVAETLARLSDELLAHVDREEQLLFPACVAVETGTGPVDGPALLDELEHDHADAGEALRVLRLLTDGYAAGTARCGTHRALLDGLAALERDLHLHIHEENTILFPRTRNGLAGPKGGER